MAEAVAAPVEPTALAAALTLTVPLLVKFIASGSTLCHTPIALANAFADVPTAVAWAPTFSVPLFDTLTEPEVAKPICPKPSAVAEALAAPTGLVVAAVPVPVTVVALATALAVTVTVPLFTMLRLADVPLANWPTPTAPAAANAEVPLALPDAATTIVPLLLTVSVTIVPVPACDT